ncbi:MAG: putative Ig domain-containing protein, partial [Thermoplasmata archaeon]|nr:putative Ig domain-containing protein [Thermoplasmata archaeon]
EVPTINTTNDPNATEDQEYAVDYDADDPDNDTVTWSLNTNATWLIINPITGLLNGTPTNDDVGSYWVNVSVWDGKGGFNSTNFTLNVTNVNDPPVITTSNTIVAIEDISYSVDYDAVDIDPTNDILTWSLDSNATWLSIDSNTGVLSGTPTNDDVGPYFVNVSVSDGNGGENWTEFILWVGNINDPPIITTSDIITATEDILYSVDYDALDVDPTNDVLTWTVISNASWLSITYYTGILNGTPTNADVGWFDVNVIVGDGNSKYDSHEFILTVTNVAPAIITSDLVTVDEDSYYYNDYDSDDDGQGSITWSLSTNAEWLTLDEGTGVLTGTPGNDEVGVYWVNIEVEDGNGGIGTTNFNLEVINTNDPPVIDGTDILTINEDEYYEASYSAADIDVVDILTWTYGSNASWLNWGEDNHTLYGTPDNDDVGSYGVRINLSDENGGYDEHYFSLNVININDPPSIIGAPTVFEVYAYENETVDFADYVIDVDNDISELSLSVESEYADLQDLLVTFNYPNSVSLEKVKITVSDGIDTSDPHFIQFTIDPVDIDRPTITDKTPISTNIAIDTDITVTFSESMAESITETAFVISPEVSGAFSWADTIMTFDPDSNLRYNTIYILTIKTTATDLTGNSLEKPYTWNFTTIKLDTDGDGIPDDEDNDDDNDGFLDDWEEFLGTDAQASNDTPLDTDGDGSPDGDEANAHPWMDADDDGDGVSDSDEHGIGTDPLLKDTDGDGYSDDLDEFPLDDKRWEKAKSTQDSDEDDSWIGILISIMVIIIVVILLFIFIIKPRLGAKMEMEDSAQESMETQQSQIPHQPAQTMPKVEPQMPNIRIHQQPL